MIHLNQILCPIDFSLHSKAANYYASLFAEASGAQIIYLAVNWPPRNDRRSQTACLDDLFLKLSTEVRPYIHDVRHVFEVCDGSPAKEILRLANERVVDLIVMGTHGTAGLASLLHGSVCRTVLRKASCPVMAVKNALNIGWIIEKPNQDQHQPAQSYSSGFNRKR